MDYYDGYGKRLKELSESLELLDRLEWDAQRFMTAEQHEVALRITAIYLRSLRELYELALERRHQ
jgi:hypothetical protein